MENRLKTPWYVWVMILVTGSYILIEMPFAALVVDTVGGNPSSEDLERVEHAGQLISGLAVAVALWGGILKRAYWETRLPIEVALSIVIAGVLGIGITYKAEQKLIDVIADYSSPEFRQKSARAMIAREKLVSGADLAGLTEPQGGDADAAWKTFMGLMPYVSHAQPNVLARFDAPASTILREKAAQGFVSEKSMRDGIFKTAMAPVEEGWKAYQGVIDRAKQAETASARQIDEAWRDWQMQLRQQNFGPWSPPAQVARLVLGTQRRGIAVPDNWWPADKGPWARAMWANIRPGQELALKSGLEAILGPGAKPGIGSLDAFTAHPTMQKRIREALKLPPGGGAITPGMSDAAFRNEVYLPSRQRFVDRFVAAHLANAGPFGEGGEFAALGRDAVRALVVPALALAFSMVGMLVHLVKLTNYTLTAGLYKAAFAWPARLLIAVPRLRFASIALAIGFGSCAIQGPASAITESEFFKASKSTLAERHGTWAANAVTWTIGLQQKAYPVAVQIGLRGPFAYVAPLVLPNGPKFASAPASKGMNLAGKPTPAS